VFSLTKAWRILPLIFPFIMTMRVGFPRRSIIGLSISHFFKKYSAPN